MPQLLLTNTCYAAKPIDYICYRFFSVSACVHPPGKTTACLRIVDFSPEHFDRPAVVGVLLDRPGVGAGAYLARHPDDADDHDAEFGAPAQHAGRLVHQGDRRLDGHVSRVRVRLVHRVLGRQRAPSP